MNEEKKQEFHKKINFIPPWVNSFEDLAKFARHMCYRYYQQKNEGDSLWNYVSTLYEHVDLQSWQDLAMKERIEEDEEYDRVYNGIEHAGGGRVYTNENVPKLEDIL